MSSDVIFLLANLNAVTCEKCKELGSKKGKNLKELKENIQMEIHLLQKKREYRRKEYHMVTHFTRCCGRGENMQLISYWEHMGICMFMHIFTNTEKKRAF